jgi:hypothetical protein
MALETNFITVPFLWGRDNRLHPGAPRRSRSRSTAIATADQLAAFYAGVIVLRDRQDPAAGVFLEPLLICIIGDVPDDLITELAA